jgi:hypothetical protein
MTSPWQILWPGSAIGSRPIPCLTEGFEPFEEHTCYLDTDTRVPRRLSAE